MTISYFSVRISECGSLFDAGGSAAFPDQRSLYYLAGFLNSPVTTLLIGLLNPTVNFQAWDIAKLPVKNGDAAFHAQVDAVVRQATQLAHQDWDSFETSWGFQQPSIITHRRDLLQQSHEAAEAEYRQRRLLMRDLERDNNLLFIEAYSLTDELPSEVPDDLVTLYQPSRVNDVKQLLSHAIGCVMGRYSLDSPGLVYASGGNDGFDSRQYKLFPTDADGIVPLTELDWFGDSASRRFEQFLSTAWPSEGLEQNLRFVAESIGAKNGEYPRETIRRYFADDFFKDHLQTYKRRPIYWLFTSGRLGAFQCLVYMHRYNEGTLARMRTEYVIPLIGKIKPRIEQLKGDIDAAGTAALKKKLKKEHDLLIQHLAELAPVDRTLLDKPKAVGPTFDEKLRHYADQRIKIDLDDGVKANYAKFADLLANVPQVCGRGEDDE